MSNEKKPLAVGALFPKGKLRLLGGAPPTFTKPLTVVEFWDPDLDQERARLDRLHEHHKRHGDRVDFVVLTPEDADDDDLPAPLPGLNWAQVEDELEEDFKGEIGDQFSMIFDHKRRLIWRGSQGGLDGTLSLLLSCKLTPVALVELGAMRQRFDALESSYKDDDVDQEDTCEVALSILDRNPADTEVLESAIDTAQSFDLASDFWALVGRIRPEFFSPDDAFALAASLIDSTSLHLRAPKPALALVEHHKGASLSWGDPYVNGAEVYAFVGDFAEALRWLEKAVAVDPEDDEVTGALAVMRERAGLAARRR